MRSGAKLSGMKELLPRMTERSRAIVFHHKEMGPRFIDCVNPVEDIQLCKLPVQVFCDVPCRSNVKEIAEDLAFMQCQKVIYIRFRPGIESPFFLVRGIHPVR